MTTTQGAIRRLELLLARTPDMECADDLRVVLADAVLSRRLLDDARAQKPVGETCFDAQGIRWYNTSDRERLPFGTKLYAAAPVPAQSAADVAAIAKAVRDIPSRLESLGGQRFAYVKLSEVIETIYSVAGKQPAEVPEAVAKGWVPNGWLIRPLNDGAIQVRAPDDRVEIGYRFAADSDTAQARTTYKLLRAILSATDTEGRKDD